MTDANDEQEARLPQPGGPEYDPGGDFEYDEAHGAGDHVDVPAALVEEAERRRSLAAPH
ncbi:hypothetical protein GCM10010168_32730 [Actinoplanes ianthinogenes]|uniref:Uncharacterized protein n=1 Tax=Actinoplanes ianthinogenes TaxID=122358 RepID=A0ABM7LMI8_9ACTN|nr:hypothetical protein [Actinoplanes ianthinogenes]BCJ40413.1 hypothetical protein Aiant_10700 [Actinoplanes ianthinogenes]GGR12093.1 hypothetical protein GCM10010168_32730 [Actinoplanes ianthinogenes]